jgi:Zn-finger nucleic acid-binding protein
MKCPACQIDLPMTEPQGIEIDFRPQCRGVWFDRGELDKHTGRPGADRPTAAPADRHTYERRAPVEERWDDDEDERHGYRGRRRTSFLDEVFDCG